MIQYFIAGIGTGLGTMIVIGFYKYIIKNGVDTK